MVCILTRNVKTNRQTYVGIYTDTELPFNSTFNWFNRSFQVISSSKKIENCFYTQVAPVDSKIIITNFLAGSRIHVKSNTYFPVNDTIDEIKKYVCTSINYIDEEHRLISQMIDLDLQKQYELANAVHDKWKKLTNYEE